MGAARPPPALPGLPRSTARPGPDLPVSCPRSSADAELTSLCQSVLEDFNLCLFYLPSAPSRSLAGEDEEECESGCAFLPDLLIFQMVVVCLMGVHSLRRAGEARGRRPGKGGPVRRPRSREGDTGGRARGVAGPGAAGP